MIEKQSRGGGVFELIKVRLKNHCQLSMPRVIIL